MSSVVYLPKKESSGPIIGQALGNVLQQINERDLERERAKRVGELVNAVNSAPDRSTALDIVARASEGVVRNAQEYSLLYKHIDERYPPGDDTPVGVDLYHPITGEPTKAFVKRDELPKLSDPAYRGKLGAGYEQLQPIKPKVRTYVNEKTGDVQQLTDQAAPLFPGYVPKEVFDRGEKRAADKRAEDRLTMEQRRLGLAEQSAARAAGAAERTASASERSAEHSDRTYLSGEMVKANNLIAAQLGANKLQDGTFDLSSLDDPKLSKFREASVKAGKLLRSKKATDHVDAVEQVSDVIGAKPAPPPAAVAASSAGSTKEGTESKSKSGKPIIFRNGKWEYK